MLRKAGHIARSFFCILHQLFIILDKIMAIYCIFAVFFVPLCAICGHSRSSNEDYMFQQNRWPIEDGIEVRLVVTCEPQAILHSGLEPGYPYDTLCGVARE